MTKKKAKQTMSDAAFARQFLNRKSFGFASFIVFALHLTACGPAAPSASDAAAVTAQQSQDGKQSAQETLQSTDEFTTGDGLIADREALPGALLYAENCALCHEGSVPKAPHFNWLELLAPATIVNALEGGVMAAQGAELTPKEHLLIAEYITRQPVANGLPEVPRPPVCEGPALSFDRSKPAAAVSWGHDPRRMIPQEVAGLTLTDMQDLELKWSYAFPNATRARSQPAIAYGAVFVGSQDGTVYAFDLETGCERWRFQASAEVRTAMVLTPALDDGTSPESPMLYFGDIISNFYALNALTGDLAWSMKMDEHPSATLTGSPLLHGDTIFVPVSSLEIIPAADPTYECCTFRGSVAALDSATGALKWRFYPIENAPTKVSETDYGTAVFGPSGAPVWVNPMIDLKRGVLYFGTGENYSSPADSNSDAIFAVDIKTGERLWQRQTIRDDAWNVACMMEDNPNCPVENGPDFDHSASTLLVDLPSGKQVLVTGHKNGTVFGLDPDNKGKLLWQTRVGRGSIQGGVHFGIAADGHTVYVPINDMNNTRNGEYLDPSLARPGVHAVDARDGSILWSKVQDNICGDNRPFCDPGISAAVTAIDGGVVAGHLDGVVRAYRKSDGEILWAYDTTQPVETTTGAIGKGGGMSGPGITAKDGYVALNSGYGLYYHEPGNLFLVFGKKS